MKFSRCCSAPLQGHLDNIKRVDGYLARIQHARLELFVHLPDYSAILIPYHNWTRTVHGNVKELVPIEAPPPFEEDFILISYVYILSKACGYQAIWPVLKALVYWEGYTELIE